MYVCIYVHTQSINNSSLMPLCSMSSQLAVSLVENRGTDKVTACIIIILFQVFIVVCYFECFLFIYKTIENQEIYKNEREADTNYLRACQRQSSFIFQNNLFLCICLYAYNYVLYACKFCGIKLCSGYLYNWHYIY